MPYLLIMRVSNSKGYPYRLISDTIPRVGEIILYLEHPTYLEHRFRVDKVMHLYAERNDEDNLTQKGYSIVDGFVKLEIFVTKTSTDE